ERLEQLLQVTAVDPVGQVPTCGRCCCRRRRARAAPSSGRSPTPCRRRGRPATATSSPATSPRVAWARGCEGRGEGDITARRPPRGARPGGPPGDPPRPLRTPLVWGRALPRCGGGCSVRRVRPRRPGPPPSPLPRLPGRPPVERARPRGPRAPVPPLSP